MCWASLHLACDQEGRARQQMARWSGMQEVSGLDAAHKDDQTYGKENPVQDMKYYLCSLGSVYSHIYRELWSDYRHHLHPRKHKGRGIQDLKKQNKKTIVLFKTEKSKQGFPVVPTVCSKLDPCGRQQCAKLEKSSETWPVWSTAGSEKWNMGADA